MVHGGQSRRPSRRIPTFQRILRIIHRNQDMVFKKEGSARSLLFREIARLGMEAFQRRAPVVWTTSYVFPMEMIWGLGLIPVDFEIYAGLLSAANQAGPMLKAADSVGLPQDTCTVHRIAVGAAHLDQLPRPDILVSTTHYCDGKAKTNEFMASHYGVDYLLLDMPMEETPAALGYLKAQLEEIFERLCELAGRPVDEGLLREPIRHFNEMTRAMRRVSEMRKESPSPLLPNNGGFTLTFMTTMLYGTPLATEIYRRVEATFREEKAAGAVPPETLRFLWLMASPTYTAPIFPWLEQRGGRVVMEELSHCYWEELDISRPLESIAKRMLSNTFLGPVERRARTALELAREYGVDAVINFAHPPCRQSNGALHVIKDRLEKHGFRLINLEADLSDPSNFPEDRLRDQLLTYWEILLREKEKVGAGET